MSKLEKLSSGFATWKWLSGISAKEKQWFLEAVRSRNGYEAWMTHLSQGLRDEQFLLEFEKTADPWERARLVGERISSLRASFLKLTIIDGIVHGMIEQNPPETIMKFIRYNSMKAVAQLTAKYQPVRRKPPKVPRSN